MLDWSEDPRKRNAQRSQGQKGRAGGFFVGMLVINNGNDTDHVAPATYATCCLALVLVVCFCH